MKNTGYTLRIGQRWKADTLDLKPNLLSVLIGVNDNSRGVPLEEYEQTYDKLLTEARTANQKLKLVLCEPFSLPVGAKKNGWDAWYEGIKQRQAIVAKLAGKFNAVVVPFQKAFDEACKRAPADHWIWDGVHPTYSGHQIMANQPRANQLLPARYSGAARGAGAFRGWAETVGCVRSN